MNERTELPEQYRQLLEEIEEILINEGGERQEADSLYGFCAHLASTVPQADDAFRQRLEARMAAALQQQQKVRTLGTASQDNGETRSPSWFQHLAPGVDRIKQILQFNGGLTMRKGFTLVALAAMIIVVSAVGFVPSVRAQMGEVLNTVFHFKFRGGECALGMRDFAPLNPTYIPEELTGSGMGGFGPDGEYEEAVEMKYYNDRQFVSIIQTKAPADRTLPSGTEVTVNGQPAVLVTGLEGTYDYGFYIFDDTLTETSGTPSASAQASPDSKSITYTDGKRLTWYVGDVKVEMFSNLSEEELLKIAGSLVPAEESELSSQTDFDPPSGAVQETGAVEGMPTVIMQWGSVGTNP
jgi:hypothetical protein